MRSTSIRRLNSLVLGLLLISLAVSLDGKQSPDLFGLVVDSSNRGVPGLVIRLRLVNSVEPVASTTTNQDGVFRFEKLVPQEYVLDVINGHKLLYRSPINTQEKKRLLIRLGSGPL